jgi:diaminobutyrate-2-oxoglutarate transaminase
MKVFERLESEVRSYIRDFPVVFDRASGPFLYDMEGRRYIDFFCGAGALSYGHNEPRMKQALVDYLLADGVTHSLDMATRAKGAFLERFESIVLAPRGMDYRVQFTGPTGANAVEAALKLARKVTGRANIVAFTRGYHGLSMGALAVTANSRYRHEAFVNRADVSFVPYDGYFGPDVDTLPYLQRLLEDDSSGIDRPAAIILETIQAEGGVNVASPRWLQGVQTLCRALGILLIVDDIQVGCGRAGTFFSFEQAGLDPDLVVLSKAISGYGLPMSLVLVRPSLDQWAPGEHTGTFRGNNTAFVTAAEALRFWEDAEVGATLARTSAVLETGLRTLQDAFGDLRMEVRGRGLVFGIESARPDLNARIARECFTRGLVIETCGSTRNVLKFLPPLNMPHDVLEEGLQILEQSVTAVAGERSAGGSAQASACAWIACEPRGG